MMALMDHMIGNASAEDGQKLLNYLDVLLASRDPALKSNPF